MCLRRIYTENVQKIANICSILRKTLKFILFFTAMNDSNRCNLLFLLHKPVILYIVGKDIQ